MFWIILLAIWILIVSLVNGGIIISEVNRKMAELDDKLTEIETSIQAAIARVQEDVDFLRQGANLTPEQRARLDSIDATMDALDPVPENP